MKRLKIQVLVASLFTLPLLIPMIEEFFLLPFSIPPLWQLIFASVVQFVAGYSFYQGAFSGLLKGIIGMDMLVTIGTSAAFFSSAAIVLMSIQGHLYFETSAVLITLILVGRLLEEKSKQGAQKGMQSLLKMQAKSARIRQDGKEVEKSIELVQVGEIIIVKPGERIPVDGEVEAGESHVDESMLTGESREVKKQKKDEVFSGTINSEGTLDVKAKRLGKETSLSHIIQLVEKAQQSKAPIQKRVDLIARIFVPFVIAVALITFLTWAFFFQNWEEAWVSGIAVLVIACPCALGLATPMVIKVACDKAASQSILIKDAETFEKVNQLDALIVDKTGTVTEGKLSVEEVKTDDPTFLKKVGSLTQNSDHPLSKAITHYIQKKGVDLEKCEAFHSHAGQGLSGVFQGKAYLLGSYRFFQNEKVNLGSFADALRLDERIVAALAEEGNCIGILFLADAIKEGSLQAIDALKKMKKKIYLISGDRQATTEAVGKALKVDGFFAEVIPEEKAQHVEKLKNEKKNVGMIGDGVNDAPALAAADVGFAIASGTDVAMENASIGLMNSSLMSVVTSFKLARKTIKKIRQNLFFAFIYNIIGIPLAALGLLNPMIAGAAMALSSLSVVLNSLSLRK